MNNNKPFRKSLKGKQLLSKLDDTSSSKKTLTKECNCLRAYGHSKTCPAFIKKEHKGADV